MFCKIVVLSNFWTSRFMVVFCLQRVPPIFPVEPKAISWLTSAARPSLGGIFSVKMGANGKVFLPKKMGEVGWVKKEALKTTADLLACLLQGPQRVRKVLLEVLTLGGDVPFRTGYGARVLPYNSQGGDAITTGMSFLVNLHLVDPPARDGAMLQAGGQVEGISWEGKWLCCGQVLRLPQDPFRDLCGMG